MRRVNLIPTAGAGQRFVDAGYNVPKPLIEIDGLPMVVQAAKTLPPADHWIFICRDEHVCEYEIDQKLNRHFPDAKIVHASYLTEGQACTCLLAKEYLYPDDELTIGACDNAVDYNLDTYKEQLSESDALVWTFRNNRAVLRNPKMYGWVEIDQKGQAIKVSCKDPISEQPIKDHAVVGTFSFKRADTFIRCVESMIAKDRRINGEFFMDVALDECIQLGCVVRTVEVQKYVCWGTPKDLIEYNIGGNE